MQTSLVRQLHEERKARLVRMRAWQEKPPVQLPKRDIPVPPLKVVLNEVRETKAEEEVVWWSKPPRHKGWFWVVNKPDAESLKVHHVLKAVAAYYDRSLTQILSDRRTADIVRPRMVTCYVARKLTTAPLSTIGKVIGKDHTSVMYAIKKLELTAHEDGEIQQIINALIGESNENTQGSPNPDQSSGEMCNDPQRSELGGQQDPAILGGPEAPAARPCQARRPD
jgi:hypothetical protein